MPFGWRPDEAEGGKKGGTKGKEARLSQQPTWEGEDGPEPGSHCRTCTSMHCAVPT